VYRVRESERARTEGANGPVSVVLFGTSYSPSIRFAGRNDLVPVTASLLQPYCAPRRSTTSSADPPIYGGARPQVVCTRINTCIQHTDNNLSTVTCATCVCEGERWVRVHGELCSIYICILLYKHHSQIVLL
jgi:hypothetical protein